MPDACHPGIWLVVVGPMVSRQVPVQVRTLHPVSVPLGSCMPSRNLYNLVDLHNICPGVPQAAKYYLVEYLYKEY